MEFRFFPPLRVVLSSRLVLRPVLFSSGLGCPYVYAVVEKLPWVPRKGEVCRYRTVGGVNTHRRVPRGECTQADRAAAQAGAIMRFHAWAVSWPNPLCAQPPGTGCSGARVARGGLLRVQRVHTVWICSDTLRRTAREMRCAK